MKIGILGLAHGHVNMYCSQWLKNSDLDIQVTAAWDHDAERLATAAEAYGIQPCSTPVRLLEQDDIEAIVVASETSMHAELVELAAAAGKAIVLQKPMALNMEEAERIVAAVNAAQVPFTMAWQMRVDPENLRIKELIEAGTLGRIYQIRRRHCLGVLLNPGFESSWHVAPQYNRDIFADDAAHAIDFLYWILGMPQAVTARMFTAHKASMPNDHGIVIFDYPEGLLAEVSSSFASAAGENTTEVVGEKGVLIQNYGDGPSSQIRLDPNAPSLKWFLRESREWVVSDVAAPKTQGERISGLVAPLAEFLHGQRPPLAKVDEGYNVQRLVQACYEANDTGRRVELH